MLSLKEFADFMQSLALGSHGLTPDEAANKLEAFGKELLDAAELLRKYQFSPWISREGLGDRCHMQVVGPDGEVKEDKLHGNWN